MRQHQAAHVFISSPSGKKVHGVVKTVTCERKANIFQRPTLIKITTRREKKVGASASIVTRSPNRGMGSVTLVRVPLIAVCLGVDFFPISGGKEIPENEVQYVKIQRWGFLVQLFFYIYSRPMPFDLLQFSLMRVLLLFRIEKRQQRNGGKRKESGEAAAHPPLLFPQAGRTHTKEAAGAPD